MMTKSNNNNSASKTRKTFSDIDQDVVNRLEDGAGTSNPEIIDDHSGHSRNNTMKDVVHSVHTTSVDNIDHCWSDVDDDYSTRSDNFVRIVFDAIGEHDVDMDLKNVTVDHDDDDHDHDGSIDSGITVYNFDDNDNDANDKNETINSQHDDENDINSVSDIEMVTRTTSVTTKGNSEHSNVLNASSVVDITPDGVDDASISSTSSIADLALPMDTTTTTQQQNPPATGRYQKMKHYFVRVIINILLFPVILVLNLLLLIFIIFVLLYIISVSCFCPKRFYSQHNYSKRQIHNNIVKRKCLNVVKNSIETLPDDTLTRQGCRDTYKVGSSTSTGISPAAATILRSKDKRITVRTMSNIPVDDRVKDDLFYLHTESKLFVYAKPNKYRVFKKKQKVTEATSSMNPTNHVSEQKEIEMINQKRPSENIHHDDDIESNLHGCTNKANRSLNSVQSDGNKEPFAPATATAVTSTDDQNDDDDDDLYNLGEGCDICMSKFKKNDIVTFSKNPICQHMFHEECILNWLCGKQLKKTCPCCRSDYLYFPKK